MARYSLKITDCNLPTCNWCPRLGWPQWSFAEIVGIKKLESLCYRAALFAWSYV